MPCYVESKQWHLPFKQNMQSPKIANAKRGRELPKNQQKYWLACQKYFITSDVLGATDNVINDQTGLPNQQPEPTKAKPPTGNTANIFNFKEMFENSYLYARTLPTLGVNIFKFQGNVSKILYTLMGIVSCTFTILQVPFIPKASGYCSAYL